MDCYQTMLAIKRRKRALHRFFVGNAMPGDYQLVTLTTPAGNGVDMHRAWRMLVMRLRRRGMAREYYAVKEYNKARSCEHIHVVFRSSWISYLLMRALWSSVVYKLCGQRVLWTHHDRVQSKQGLAYYLAKYLSKNMDNAPGERGYWYSYDWVYRKWCAFCREVYRWGGKLSEDVLVWLHGLSPDNRRDAETDILYRVWYDYVSGKDEMWYIDVVPDGRGNADVFRTAVHNTRIMRDYGLSYWMKDAQGGFSRFVDRFGRYWVRSIRNRPDWSVIGRCIHVPYTEALT